LIPGRGKEGIFVEWSYTSTPPIRLHGVVLTAQG